MYRPTAADFADTGQWRLLLKIGNTGIDAALKNTLHPEIPLQELCKASWPEEPERLKDKIEDAVYNNPRLLDDFSTKIIFYDTPTLLIPSDVAESAAGVEEEQYIKIYPCSPQDIMSERDGDITAVWALAAGLKSFLMRTFPGARFTANLIDKVKFLRRENQGLSIFVFVRKNESDFIFLDNDRLISASSHPVFSADDVAALINKLVTAYRFIDSPVNLFIKSQFPLQSIQEQLPPDIILSYNFPHYENN